jgi:asparagine synthase (glutamine-hydrolysing)
VYFASELKALIDIPALKNLLSIDTAAMQAFLHLGYIPDPASIYTGIRKLPPAGRMLITESGTTIDTYWNAEHFATYDAQLTPDNAEAKLRTLLEQSVQRQMISDVPFGVFLSGGVDSSLVAALATQASGTPVSTFTIGFEEAAHDESRYAERVAKIIGSKHQCFMLHWNDALAKITEGMDLYDEPFADSSFLPLMMVSEQASRTVKMVLTGEGGDELFYGYGVHAWANRLSNPLKKQVYAAARPFLPVLGQRGKRVKQLLAYQGSGFNMAHLFSQEQYLFSQAEISDLLLVKPAMVYIPPDSRFLANPNATATDRQALFDLLYYLPGDLLTKVDRASMHYSLESRVPLLDHELVEFALSLPLRLKTDGKVWKWLLKRTLAHYLPEELFNRPKQGFSVPLASWLRKDLRFLADTLLSEDAIAETGFFDPGIVKKLKKDFYFGNQTYLYNRIWLLIVIQRWFVRNQIRNVI